MICCQEQVTAMRNNEAGDDRECYFIKCDQRRTL